MTCPVNLIAMPNPSCLSHPTAMYKDIVSYTDPGCCMLMLLCAVTRNAVIHDGWDSRTKCLSWRQLQNHLDLCGLRCCVSAAGDSIGRAYPRSAHQSSSTQLLHDVNGASLLMPTWGNDVVSVLQVIGLVGSSRKRTLMLWQAVELSRVMDRPNLATLQIARKALEPPDDPLEQVKLLQVMLVQIFMTTICV